MAGWKRLREGTARLEAEDARPAPQLWVRMSGGARWGPGPAGSGERCAGSRSGRALRLSARALHCTRSGRAETAPRCALLWSAGNEPRAQGDRKWQLRGLGRVPRKDLSLQATAPVVSAAFPYPLRFFDFSSAQAPAPGGADPGPRGLPRSLPSPALVLSSAPGVEPLGGASGWRGKGTVAPRTWEGRP